MADRKLTYDEVARDLDEKYRWQDEMMAQQYSSFHANLKDIDEECVSRLGYGDSPKHLNETEFSTPAFPVTGKIVEGNLRLMAPLAFKDLSNPDSKVINVWCMVNTGSRFTCLSVKTLEAFMGVGKVNVTDWKTYPFAVQDPNSKIDCYVSKVGSDFEHVNILGMNALEELSLSIPINWNCKKFRLVKYNMDLYIG